LVALLTKDGHIVPKPAGKLLGASDPVHLEHAIRNQLVVLTSDADDFRELHELIITAKVNHFGIMVVKYDDNAGHTMKPKHIAAAIGKLEKFGIIMANELIVLNHWR
jgi:hypothetical protein